ncbi:MAG: hypothetical protein NPIRA03_01890 [Nitrospirales bacterium]|nr:MAG: hypothetical protein NPIRA03_01890 [Nitrospirales bacterium]
MELTRVSEIHVISRGNGGDTDERIGKASDAAVVTFEIFRTICWVGAPFRACPTIVEIGAHTDTLELKGICRGVYFNVCGLF